MSQLVPRRTHSNRNEEPCPSCGLLLDVEEEAIFALVKCPGCRSLTHVRKVLGPYQLVGILGQGGSSRVFRARLRNAGGKEQAETAPDIALKVLDKRNPDYGDHLLHLRNEAKYARQVHHPRVVKVLALEEEAVGAYLSMEIMEGGSLHDLIVSGVKISEERILETGLEILKALSAAYAKGIVHRDLKPANILFAANGGAKLADFGLACHLNSSGAAGANLMATPDYVAPEILSEKRWDFRSDLYSLGGCLYHAITGHPPHRTEGETLQQLRVIKRHLVNLSSSKWKLLPETASLINRMLLPDPENRHSSYGELEEAFLASLDSLARSKKNFLDRGVRTLLDVFREKR